MTVRYELIMIKNTTRDLQQSTKINFAACLVWDCIIYVSRLSRLRRCGGGFGVGLRWWCGVVVVESGARRNVSLNRFSKVRSISRKKRLRNTRNRTYMQ